LTTLVNNLVFETERLKILRYTTGDLHHFFKLNGDADVMRYIRPAQTLEQTEEFLQRIISDYETWPGMGRWAMFSRDDQQFVGSFAIIPVENSGRFQLGYALVKNDWGKGYASESVKGGIQYAFDRLGLKEIAGITFPENVSSQKVLLKNGFVFDSSFTEDEKQLNLYICRKIVLPGDPV
jgi:RimJ/RimL family protein N-acetyltransferase